MKIAINGKKNESIPPSWDEVTFEQSLKLVKIQDDKGELDTADIIGTFLNMDPATLRKARISNINEVIRAVQFTNTKPVEIVPKSINGFLIPKDLNFQSICRFEDLKELVKKVLPKDGEPIKAENIKYYPEIVGVYAMPDYENATPQQREEFAQQFFKSPCGEVLAIGNFTLMRLTVLSLPGSKTFHRVSTLIRKLRLVLKGFNARLDSTVRFYIWKKKHRINVTNF